MKFERDEAQGRNTFSGYGEGYVAVGGKRHSTSLVVSAERVITDWPAVSVESLSADHLAAIVELKPEIVLLGTGAKFTFIPQKGSAESVAARSRAFCRAC